MSMPLISTWIVPSPPEGLEALHADGRLASLADLALLARQARLRRRARAAAALRMPMTLDGAEFIRPFFRHVLPSGFHRIRHSGLFAATVRARNIERARQARRLGNEHPGRR